VGPTHTEKKQAMAKNKEEKKKNSQGNTKKNKKKNEEKASPSQQHNMGGEGGLVERMQQPQTQKGGRFDKTHSHFHFQNKKKNNEKPLTKEMMWNKSCQAMVEIWERNQ